MRQLGPAFDVREDRRRCLTAAGISLGCMVGIWLLSRIVADGASGWWSRLNAVGLMLLLAVGGWVFSMVTWVRWLDWTRGRTMMKKGSV